MAVWKPRGKFHCSKSNWDDNQKNIIHALGAENVSIAYDGQDAIVYCNSEYFDNRGDCPNYGILFKIDDNGVWHVEKVELQESTPRHEQKSKYHRTVHGVCIDVYDILKAFEVTCPARQHAIKKLLAAGKRGNKTEQQDLQEAMSGIQRSIELYEIHNHEL